MPHCQKPECFTHTNSTQGVLSISWVRAGNQLQKLHQNSSKKGRLLLRMHVISISGLAHAGLREPKLSKALSRESSSVGFQEEAPQPCSAFLSFPLLSHSKAAPAPRCRSALSPTTKELLSSFTVSNTFLNYKISFFQKKKKVPLIQDYPGANPPETRTLDSNSWGTARKDKMHNIISLTLFAVMGLNWKKIKELRPPREPRAEAGLGKFPIPRFGFSLCHTTSPSHPSTGRFPKVL